MYKRIFKILILIVLTFMTSCSNSKILKYRDTAIDYLENMNYEDALEYFNEALKAGNGEVGNVQYDILMYKAECLFMLKKYEEAKRIYSILLKIDKHNKTYNELFDNVSSVVSLVEFKDALDNNDIEKADAVLAEITRLGKEHDKSVMFNQAVYYEKKGEWKNALNAFNYYLKQYPDDDDAMHEVEFINAQLNYGN